MGERVAYVFDCDHFLTEETVIYPQQVAKIDFHAEGAQGAGRPESVGVQPLCQWATVFHRPKMAAYLAIKTILQDGCGYDRSGPV